MAVTLRAGLVSRTMICAGKNRKVTAAIGQDLYQCIRLRKVVGHHPSLLVNHRASAGVINIYLFAVNLA